MMLNRSLSILCRWLGLSLIIFSVGLIGCQPVASTTPTPVISLLPTTETGEPTATSIVSVPTATVQPTFTSTPTIIPTPTGVNTSTPTPSPTVSPLQKISELPIRGQFLSISPDGTLIAAMDTRALILHVFDLVQQEVKWEFERETYSFTTLAFSPDGSLLAAGGTEQQVLVWDMVNGNLLYDLSVPYTKIERVSFSPDGKLLAASSYERFLGQDVDVMLWNIDTGQLIDTFPSQNTPNITIPDERDNVSVGYATWNVEDIGFIPSHPDLLAMTILNHYEKDDGSIWALYFWDIEGQELQEILPGMIGFDIAVSPDGQWLATEIDEQLIVWDTHNSLKILEITPTVTETTPRLAITDTGILARLEEEKVITIWNLKGELLATLEKDDFITDIAFTPNGDLLVASFAEGKDAPVEIWRINE